VPHHRCAAAGSDEIADLPMIKRGIRRLRRDDTSVQLGLDPDRAVVLTGLDEAVVRWLDHVDGSHQRPSLLHLAETMGVPRAAAVGVLDLLASAGLLDDARIERSAYAALPVAERERLRPDLVALALRARSPDAGARLLADRRNAAVEVRGSATSPCATVAAPGRRTWHRLACRPRTSVPDAKPLPAPPSGGWLLGPVRHCPQDARCPIWCCSHPMARCPPATGRPCCGRACRICSLPYGRPRGSSARWFCLAARPA
jgi:hypothetical protein